MNLYLEPKIPNKKEVMFNICLEQQKTGPQWRLRYDDPNGLRKVMYFAYLEDAYWYITNERFI